MSTPMLPADGSYIEMTAAGETMPNVRVVHATDTSITLSLAIADLPPENAKVTLRWGAPRGRYALPGNVTAIDGNRVDVRFKGEPAIEQSRDYVRGGGGESIVLMLREDGEPFEGVIRDISERSVRAHFTDVEVQPGDEFALRIQLEDEIFEIPARAMKINSVRQQVPHRGPLMVEMVAIFTGTDERVAKVIRHYIFQMQMRNRKKAN